ncbi:hypothetical protein DCAR_0933360 [Daucus carota subsp. sativus]|uniref:TF-B3 domain-containing protein n=1 Tax=Daucus carota subsp. sativus TaxID=79200 RepID=A0AAF1BBS6_DAUCS|nr:hypothetical protein DCAR_0933360 [Daucus carota subsp. sativus]
MLTSHVAGCFWLGLPKKFTEMYLPKEDVIVVLVDESEGEHETKYLAEKSGLSGGWRGFSVAHNLQENDVLVFHLIQEFRFKVYIVRANALSEVDGATDLLNLGACERKTESDVKNFENFSVTVDRIILDNEIPHDRRVKYYQLCCSQKSYLHDQLIEMLSLHLVVGIILETVSISDAISSSKPSSYRDLKAWDDTLKSFEILGMKVGFLRAKIVKLLTLSSDSEDALQCKIVEKANAEGELKALEIRRSSLKEVIENLAHEIEAMKIKAQNIEAAFQEESKAPW